MATTAATARRRASFASSTPTDRGCGPATAAWCSNFLVQALDGEPLTVYGDGKQTRSFCYVDDQVGGLLALLDSDYIGPVNIGNPDEFTMLELAEVVHRGHRVASEIVFEPLPVDDPTRRRPDITLAASCSAGSRRSNCARAARTARVVQDASSRRPPDIDTGVVHQIVGDRADLQRTQHGRRDDASHARLSNCLFYRAGILLVDDASSDGTLEVLAPARRFHDAGRASTTRTGARAQRSEPASSTSRATCVLIQDADLEYDPEDWPKLLAPIFRGKAHRGLRLSVHR